MGQEADNSLRIGTKTPRHPIEQEEQIIDVHCHWEVNSQSELG